MLLVPTLLRAILATGGDGLAERLGSMRYLMVGGEPFPTALLRDVQAALPHVGVLQFYGASEVWDATWTPVDEVDGGRADGADRPADREHARRGPRRPTSSGCRSGRSGEVAVAGAGIAARAT